MSQDYGIESHYQMPIGKIDIKVIVDINRGLIENEVDFISSFVGNLKTILAQNTMVNDFTFKGEMAEERKQLLACFDSPIYVEEILNGYSPSSPIAKPWFIVTTHKGRIKIGWRKRVISIDWSDSEIQADGDYIFKDESVTTGRHLVHAWSYEKAKEYINRLLS